MDGACAEGRAGEVGEKEKDMKGEDQVLMSCTGGPAWETRTRR